VSAALLLPTLAVACRHLCRCPNSPMLFPFIHFVSSSREEEEEEEEVRPPVLLLLCHYFTNPVDLQQ
jgi:hypothetical protein